MTTAAPLARYGAMWKARVASGSATVELPTSWDTTHGQGGQTAVEEPPWGRVSKGVGLKAAVLPVGQRTCAPKDFNLAANQPKRSAR